MPLQFILQHTVTESGIIKVQLAVKLAKTVHFKNLSKTALQFILQHTVTEKQNFQPTWPADNKVTCVVMWHMTWHLTQHLLEQDQHLLLLVARLVGKSGYITPSADLSRLLDGINTSGGW